VLAGAGFEIVAAPRPIEIGLQRVRPDLLVRVRGEDLPVFVFPGRDPEKDAHVFSFLAAALREAGHVRASPIYYAPASLPDIQPPTGSKMADLAHAFVERTALPGRVLWSLPARGVMEIVRAFAKEPVESGGGRAVDEAAAFVGEWLRRRTNGQWILREDLPRSLLCTASASGATQYFLPLFAAFPDAVRTGYDGWDDLLEGIVDETTREAPASLVVRPAAYGPPVETWLAKLLFASTAQESALVLRRCAACGTLVEMRIAPADPEARYFDVPEEFALSEDDRAYPSPLRPLGNDATRDEPAKTEADIDEAAARFIPLALKHCFGFLQVPVEACQCGSTDYRGAMVVDRVPELDGLHSLLTIVYASETHSRIATYRLAEAAARAEIFGAEDASFA
jgi:hypothetical protein